VWDALAPLEIELDDAGDDDGDSLVATVPTFRPDLEREIDLIEEVARRIGFDRIGRTLPDTHGQVGALTQRQRERRVVADALVGMGLSEAITLPLVSPADLQRAGAPLDRVVRASNPLRAEESVLRTRILAGLLRAVAFNRSHGIGDVALFEMGHVFDSPAGNDGPLPDEPEHVAVALAGAIRRRPVEDDRPVDVYDAVDALRVVADSVNVAEIDFVAADVAGYRPARAARVRAGGADVGVIGEVGDVVLDALGLEAPVVAFEVSLDGLLAAPRRDRTFAAPSRYPISSIDLAFSVGDSEPAAALARTLRKAAGELLEDVRVFDVFRSDALGPGRRSVAFSLRLRAPDRTLTDAEVGELRQRAIDAVVAEHGAELRG
jgi:phenylalanyl-tRNA synthetase beta chain